MSEKEWVEEAIRKLKQCQGSGDTEMQHSDADDILCELLSRLGYQEVVAEWQAVNKWYA